MSTLVRVMRPVRDANVAPDAAINPSKLQPFRNEHVAGDAAIQSEKVEFLPVGVAAMKRPVRSKLRDFVNAADYATLEAALDASGTVYVTTPIAVSVSLTVPADKSIIVLADGSITVAAGQTLTIRGGFSAPRRRIFFGGGSVVGIRHVYPEWWGAAADGITLCSPAFAAAMTCLEASLSSAGGRPTFEMAGGVYLLSSVFTVRPTASFNVLIKGAGSVLGTRLRAAASFSGLMLVHVNGTSNASLDRIADFDIGGFSLDRQPGSSCLVGMWVGGNDTDVNLVGMQNSIIRSVHVSEFPVCWVFNQVRLVKVSRCSGWVEAIPGGIGLKLELNDPLLFTGDLEFEHCQFVGTLGEGRANLRIEHNGPGQIKGLNFHRCIFYKADFAVSVYADGGAQFGDWWFRDCQFDGWTRRVLNVDVHGLSTVVDDIHMDHYYARGLLGPVAYINQTAGRVAAIWFTNGWVRDAHCGDFPLFEMHGTMAAIHITGNTFEEVASTQAMIVFYDSATDLDVSHNTIRKLNTATADRFMVLSAETDRYVVVGNKTTPDTFASAFVTELNGAAIKWVAGNLF